MITQLEKDLLRDEGSRSRIYQDSLGFWTIGVGRLVDPRSQKGLSPDEIKYLLRNDIQEALQDITNESWYQSLETNGQRRAVLNMRFQLGGEGLRKFVRSLKLLEEGKWLEAGQEFRKSKWYSQTPERAERVIRLIEMKDN